MSPPNGTITDNGPDQTGIDPFPGAANATSNELVSFQYQAKTLNASLVTQWDDYFNGTFLVELNDQTIAPTSQPHQPPNSWVASLDANGNPQLLQNGPPVLTVPSFKAPTFVPSQPILGPGSPNTGPAASAPSTVTVNSTTLQALLAELLAQLGIS